MKDIIKLSKKSTLIILDWDDTLFPTTWVMKSGLDMNNNDNKLSYKVYFSNLDNNISNLLDTLNKFGTVIIITNAAPEWVKISSSVLPKTSNILKNIKVISARKMYQAVSNSSMEWKINAFNDELLKYTNDIHFNNIISIGDAEYEHNALVSLHKNDKKKYRLLKSIKFIDKPSHDIIIDQIKVIRNCIHDICLRKVHLHLKFKSV